MNNINGIGVKSLSYNELRTIDGGVLAPALIEVGIDFIQWSYTEFKKGLDDGLNGN